MSVRSIRLLSAATAALLLTACSATDEVPTGVEASQAIAGLNEAAAPVAGTKIPDRYIVVFKDQVGNPASEAAAMMRGRGGEIHFTYEHAIKGFAATIPAAAVEAIRRNPKVAYVEQDAVVTTTATTTQSGATWGLDRIDQRLRPLNGSYSYENTGAGVYAYIIDTGILGSHVEFTGRMAPGYTAINDGLGTSDCDGHGTHVAGTTAGTVYGVAKGATVIPVRVLDCSGSGTWTGVIAGVDWVAGQKKSLALASTPMVANMSLGGGASASVDAAVANAVTAGVVMVVAAGNDNRNACNFSPARTASAITVGATTSSDARASYSNFGSCLDLFAPGSSITSAWIGGTSATETISGTSMASPHVAGAVALLLQTNPTATVSQLTSTLLANTTSNVVTSAGTGSPNRLLFTGAATVEPPPPTTETAPSALTSKVTKSRNTTTITLTWVKGSDNLVRFEYRTTGNWTLRTTTTSTTRSESFKGSGTIAYRICNTTTTTLCSNEVSVTF
jgi:subtilisin family serine protease